MAETKVACSETTWDGWHSYPCRRPVKRDGMCGPHAAGRDKRIKAETARREAAEERRARGARLAERHQVLLEAEATVERVRALADEWEGMGTTSVYESATELAQILRAALDPPTTRATDQEAGV